MLIQITLQLVPFTAVRRQLNIICYDIGLKIDRRRHIFPHNLYLAEYSHSGIENELNATKFFLSRPSSLC